MAPIHPNISVPKTFLCRSISSQQHELIRRGHSQRDAGQIQRSEASNDEQVREIKKLEHGAAAVAAAEAEGIPETHDPEPRRGKAALPHDPVTGPLCCLCERI